MDGSMRSHSPALLIEDDEFAQLACQGFLSDLGFQVDCATTYDQAQHMLMQATYHLVVADVSLRREGEQVSHGMNGLGLNLVRTIKQQSPQTAVVLWTAYPHLIVHVLDLVMQGYTGITCVPKGNVAEVLREGIARALDGDVMLEIAAPRTSRPDTVFLSTLDPEVAEPVRRLADQIAMLTPRQREVADLLICTTEVIARRLVLSEKAVRNYIDAIYDRLHLKEPAMQDVRRDTLIVLAVLLYRLSAPVDHVQP